MEAKERRQRLVEILKAEKTPLTGTALAKKLQVSRQIVVGDIAILRAAGMDIFATPQGYMLPPTGKSEQVTAQIACCHDNEKLAEELNIIIDNGGKVLDVVVEHPVYGEIKANLMLNSRRDVANFIQKLTNSGAAPLSVITGGVHLHTITTETKEVLERIYGDLKSAGILME